MRALFLAPICLLFVGCGDDSTLQVHDREVCLAHADGTPYCIDMYEESRADATKTSAGTDDTSAPRSQEGFMPWTNVDWFAAKAACQAKKKRLCERDEWVDACDGTPGPGGHRYTYGDSRNPAACNTTGSAPEATGSRSTCRASTGTFDQSGNVWEWTGNIDATAAALGGGYPSSQTHECTSGQSAPIPVTTSSGEVGFRCCRG